MRFILSIILLIISIHTTLADVNNTATTDNLLPNNNTSSSSLDNFSLDGVQSGSTGSLTITLLIMVLL